MNARQKDKKYKKIAERYKDKAEAWDRQQRSELYKHAFRRGFTGVDKKPTMDGLTGEMYTKIKFHNGDFERDNTGHWLSHEEHCKK